MLKQLTDIGKDKWMHFVFSLIGTILLSALLGFFKLGAWAIGIGGAIVFLGGVGKEIYDRKHGTPEVNDIIADFVGVFVGMCLIVFAVVGFGGSF